LRDSETELREPGLQQWCDIHGMGALALATPVAGLLQKYLEKA
jgi:hypothetical protein